MNGASVKVVKAKSVKSLWGARTCARGGSFPQCDEWMIVPSMLPYHNFGKWRKTDRLGQNKKSLREIELAKGAVYCDAILLSLKSRPVK